MVIVKSIRYIKRSQEADRGAYLRKAFRLTSTLLLGQGSRRTRRASSAASVRAAPRCSSSEHSRFTLSISGRTTGFSRAGSAPRCATAPLSAACTLQRHPASYTTSP